jgi:hypothetical protein
VSVEAIGSRRRCLLRCCGVDEGEHRRGAIKVYQGRAGARHQCRQREELPVFAPVASLTLCRLSLVLLPRSSGRPLSPLSSVAMVAGDEWEGGLDSSSGRCFPF